MGHNLKEYMHRCLLAAALTVMASSAEAKEGALCPSAASAVHNRLCTESEHGLVIADDEHRARKLLSYADAGSLRFRARFGLKPVQFAIVELGDGALDKQVLAHLKTAGFQAVLPWLSPAGYRAQLEASVRRALETQAATLPPAAQAAALQRALAQFPTNAPAGGQEAGAITHELGHLWYIAAFWPGTFSNGGHYGGAGPDWMDETAAVLMESDELAAERVQNFENRYRKLRSAGLLGKVPDNSLINLPGFFASSHPAAAQARFAGRDWPGKY